MRNKNGDLPASPQSSNNGYPVSDEVGSGLTKREIFAMHMMASMSSTYWSNQDCYDSGINLVKCQAESAVEMADALLAELDKDVQ